MKAKHDPALGLIIFWFCLIVVSKPTYFETMAFQNILSIWKTVKYLHFLKLSCLIVILSIIVFHSPSVYSDLQ